MMRSRSFFFLVLFAGTALVCADEAKTGVTQVAHVERHEASYVVDAIVGGDKAGKAAGTVIEQETSNEGKTENGFIRNIIEEIRSSPLNWVLLAACVYLASSLFATPTPPPTVTAKHPEAVVFKDFTPRELVKYDGKQDGGKGRIYLAVKGRVFDVTSGRGFYGPDGPYGNFAGHDASRGLAFNSFDENVLTGLDDPIDRLEDLTEEQRQSLDEWFERFSNKYQHIGNLVEETK